jgi:hypothetical protein
MTDARPVRAKSLGPKPPSSPEIFGQDLGTFLRIAYSPVDDSDSAPRDAAAGMSLAEFAAWAGVDRRRLARHLVEVGPGPVPLMPPGKVPVRLFGKTRRIFLRDVFGEGATAPGGESYAPGTQETHPSSARRAAWDRSLDLLRDGRDLRRGQNLAFFEVPVSRRRRGPGTHFLPRGGLI